MGLVVNLQLTGLTNFYKSLSTNSPAILKTMKQWGARYRSFSQRRFDLFSKGGGNWPPLAESTIKRRRKGKRKSGTIAILRDTGTLFRALNPVLGQPGSFEQVAGLFTVELGFGGASKHPNGTASIADIAKFHNFGMGHNPTRTIIVPPDAKTREAMAQDAERNLSADGWDKTK